jgi:hypothetical protein
VEVTRKTPAKSEAKEPIERTEYLLVAFFFDCFGHFQPMCRKSKPLLSVERSNRQFGLLATFHGLLTALVGFGHELSSES